MVRPMTGKDSDERGQKITAGVPLVRLVKRRLKRKIARLEKAHRYHQVTYEQMLEMHSHANR